MENWFLIVVMVVVGLLTVAGSIYALILYQHPDDRNQAWLPKIIACLGICLAVWTVLLFPLDVANVRGCQLDVPLASCQTTLPMTQLWYADSIAIAVMAFAVVPFAMFFYEADSEWSLGKRIGSGTIWAIGCFVFLILVTVVPYELAGYVQYSVSIGVSGLLPVSYLNGTLDSCVGALADYSADDPFPGVNETLVAFGDSCDALSNGIGATWKVRVSFISYLMAILATLGWLLFMVFGGIGVVALPLDMIRAFMGRPRATIPRSQYIARAADLGRRAEEIKQLADVVAKDERSRGTNRTLRKKKRVLASQVLALQDDADKLELVYPQGEDPQYKWVAIVLSYWARLFLGILFAGLSITWFIQIVLYILVDPPLSPFLNVAFSRADGVFPLFGTLLFSLWAFYLQLAVIKGNFKFGLNLLIFRVHEMKVGQTFMSSFLFNIALLLLASLATVQFCAEAFSQYANNTVILKIFGAQLQYLEGLHYLYSTSAFVYVFLGMMGLTIIYLAIKGPDKWKRRRLEDAYET